MSLRDRKAVLTLVFLLHQITTPLCSPFFKNRCAIAGIGRAPVPLSRLVVPILLAVGWIVGCALMVYIVFS
ncbi:sarcoplasmic/endoplasmic reticulum calcium ATPase regulator DWORF isoform X1 [Anas acuta]|uniref:sarcoplasmic/endoplasmic reticulum calcium ATPase regulator DWORF isoform X1 n=1 Tax=Anas acuta TaxID=28680 RepID=UPI0035C93F94